MNSKTIFLKSKEFSFILLGAALFLLGVAILYSEFFHAPIEEIDAKKLATNPLKSEILSGIESIEIVALDSSFKLEKDSGSSDFNQDGIDDDTGASSWLISAPLIHPGRPEQIQYLLNLLKNLSPKQAFQYDEINLNNLGLANPQISLKIKSNNQNETILNIGLKNQNENLIFISILQNSKKQIYGLPIEQFNIDNINVTQFLDSKIVLGNNKNLEIIEIYQGKNLDTDPQVVLLRKDQVWYGPNYEALNEKRTADFLLNLFKIKSLFILDKVNNEGQDILDKALEKPNFTMVIKNKNNNGIVYTFSEPINYFPDVKIDRKAVIVWVSNRKQAYLVGKEEVQSINNKQSYFKD